MNRDPFALVGFITLLISALALTDAPLRAQDIPGENRLAGAEEIEQAEGSSNALGNVARAATRPFGQRLTPPNAVTNIDPLNRIANRAQNRIESRLNSRIGRVPTAQVADPFGYKRGATNRGNIGSARPR